MRLTCASTDDLTALSPELDRELRKLEHMFTVDAAKLKEISLQFEHELRQGLSRVSRCLLPSNVSRFSRHCIASHSMYRAAFRPPSANLD